MKTSNASGNFKPFKNLATLLKEKSVQLKPASLTKGDQPDKIPADPRPDQVLFREAMADVKKISRSNCAPRGPAVAEPSDSKTNLEHESLVRLKELVEYGSGFVVSLTPEYIEGRAHRVSPEVTRRLHQG